jgi:hypothetical protein
MTRCLIKNLLPDSKEPKGNNGLGFPWERVCPKPENLLGYYCNLLDEEAGEPLLLMDGQPILIECLGYVPDSIKPTPTPSVEVNRLIITSYYSSCPTTVEYSIAASFNVDVDIDVCFENIIGTTTGASLLTSVCIRIDKDTAIGYLETKVMKMFLELDHTKTFFQNEMVSPVTPSSFAYTIDFYSVFEVPGCYLAVESGTPGFTVDDSILCNDRILLEDATSGVSSSDVSVTCST